MELHYLVLIALVALMHPLVPAYVQPCFFDMSHRHTDTIIEKDDLKYLQLKKEVPRRIEGRQQNIPYLIHQTNELDLLPADMVMAIESTLEQNPEFSYHYYNGTERREFIKQHMSPTILACYDKLIPGAYKADLFRYSVVFTHGGCYTDIGFVFLRPLREALLPDDNFVSSADGLPPNVEINSAFFCAVKGHHILNITIHKLANQVGKSNYGDDMLDISGPWMLRKGFQAYHNNESMVLQQTSYTVYPKGVRLLKQGIEFTCRIYPIVNVLHNNQAILFHKYPRYAEDMSVYTKEPHYSKYWFNRTVYNESVKVLPDGDYLESLT